MKILALALLLVLNSLAYSETIDSTSDRDIVLLSKKFQYILQTINKYHVDSLDLSKVAEKSFNSLLQGLDKYSSYFNSEQLSKINSENKGVSVGIGINTAVINDTLRVVHVYDGSPALAAGLTFGDAILQINNQNALTAKGELTGTPGIVLKLKAKKIESKEIYDISIRREEVKLSSIDDSFILPNSEIGYIRSNRFTENSAEEFILAINKLKKNNPRYLIYDLKGNPGGYVDQAIRILDEMIADSVLLLKTHSKDSSYQIEFYSKKGGILSDLPICVLTDNNSHSSSEIIAGVIQDLDRGIVIGKSTEGKASVQQFWQMSDGSGFRLTVSRYSLPSGRIIEKPIPNEIVLEESSKLFSNEKERNEIISSMKQFGGRSILPVFKSKKGKLLIGESGIQPDISTIEDTLTLLTNVAITKNYFLEFAVNFLQNNSQTIRLKYNNVFYEYFKNFLLDDNVILQLKNFLVKKGLKNDLMFNKDSEYYIFYIKALIAKSLFGNSCYYQVMSSMDHDIKKAVEIFNKKN
jgi:carboxyl-terminal processing protease